MEQHTAHEFLETALGILGRAGGMGAKLPKGFGIARQLDMLEVDRASRLVAPDYEEEAPVVGDEHENSERSLQRCTCSPRASWDRARLGRLDITTPPSQRRRCRSQLVAGAASRARGGRPCRGRSPARPHPHRGFARRTAPSA